MGKKIVVFSKKEDIIANKYEWFKSTLKSGARLRVRRPTTEVASLFTFYPQQCSSYWLWSSNYEKLMLDIDFQRYLNDLPLDMFYILKLNSNIDIEKQFIYLKNQKGVVILLIDFNIISVADFTKELDKLKVISYTKLIVRFKNTPYPLKQELDNYIYFNTLLLKNAKFNIDFGICLEDIYKLPIKSKPVIDVSRLKQKLINQKDPYGDCLCHLHEDIMGFGEVSKLNLKMSDIQQGYIFENGDINFKKLELQFKEISEVDNSNIKEDEIIRSISKEVLYQAVSNLIEKLEGETINE